MKDTNYYFPLSEKRIEIILTANEYKEMRDATGKNLFLDFILDGYNEFSSETKFLKPYIINVLKKETRFITNTIFKDLFYLSEDIFDFVIDRMSITKLDSFVNSPVKIDIVIESRLTVKFFKNELNALKLKDFKLYNFIRSYGIPEYF